MFLDVFKKKLYFTCIAALLSLSFVNAASDSDIEKISVEFKQTLEDAMKKLDIQGCSVVIARKDKVMKIICLGNTNINDPKEITEDTLFPLSSLTKNITAYLALALVDEGVFSLDDKVKKYLPGFFVGNEDISEKFTIRDLISHRSGFHHFLANSHWHCGYTYEQMIASLRFINNVSGFRKKYGYQNVIFGIIGDVMEAATGKTYEELLDQYIFSKMGLQESTVKPLYVVGSWFEQVKYNFKHYGIMHALKNIFSIKTHKVVTNHIFYMGKKMACKNSDYYQRVPATAAVSMSAKDFGRWLRLLLNEGTIDNTVIVSKNGYTEITKNHVNITGLKKDNQVFPLERLKDSYYGLGTFGANYMDTDGTKGRKVFFHMGGVYGACTFFVYSPQDDIAIGILANTGGTDKTIFSELMCWEFLDKVFGYQKIDWVQTELDSKKKLEEDKLRYKKTVEEDNPGPHAELSKYLGTYTSEIYDDIKVYLKNGSLWLDNNIKQVALTHLNQHVFGINGLEFCDDPFDREEAVVFYPDENGEFNKMYVSCLDENKTVFERK